MNELDHKNTAINALISMGKTKRSSRWLLSSQLSRSSWSKWSWAPWSSSFKLRALLWRLRWRRSKPADYTITICMTICSDNNNNSELHSKLKLSEDVSLLLYYYIYLYILSEYGINKTYKRECSNVFTYKIKIKCGEKITIGLLERAMIFCSIHNLLTAEMCEFRISSQRQLYICMCICA